MYLDYYNLNEKPFQITCDPKYLWLGEVHKEALALLRYGFLVNSGIVLLTGEVGTGKTLLINHLLTLMSKEIHAVIMADPGIEGQDFDRLLADAYDLPLLSNSKSRFFLQFRKFLEQAAAEQRPVVLIIDEAHRLNNLLMEELRTLSNIERPDKKLITIFLIGQPELNTLLGEDKNRALSQRVSLRYHIECFDQADTSRYVRHRLGVAGVAGTIFKEKALRRVYKYSSGIPRLINVLCDHALLTGSIYNVQQIDADIIDECALELRLPGKRKRNATRGYDSHVTEPLSGCLKGDHCLPDPQKTTNLIHVETFDNQPRYFFGLKWLAMAIVPVLLFGVTLAWMNFNEKTLLDGYSGGMIRKDISPMPENDQASSSEANGPATRFASFGVKDPSSNHTSPAPAGDEPRFSSLAAEISEELSSHVPEPSDPLPDAGPDGMVTIGWPEGRNIPIEFDQANKIAISSMVDMDRVADDLVTFPERMVYVHGYVNFDSVPEQGRSVWRQRADRLRSYLADKGVGLHQVRMVDMGKRIIAAPVERNHHQYAVIELPSDDYAIHYNPDK